MAPITADPPDLERMQCMEVWGGNCPAEKALTMPGLNIWLSSRPHAQAAGGGDVYYVSSCASGRITRMLLADISGHGSAVIQAAVGLRDLMRRNVNMIKQTRFVRAMNRQFTRQAELHWFATALVCTYFAPTGSLQICNAGHPFPLLFRSSTRRWDLVRPPQLEPRPGRVVDTPLGVLEQADYSQLETKLEPGDMMLGFSDAFTESLSVDQTQLGAEGLLELVQSIDTTQPELFIPELIERLRGLSGANLDQDDATAILIQANGTGPSLAGNLLAPLRLLRGPRENIALSEV